MSVTRETHICSAQSAREGRRKETLPGSVASKSESPARGTKQDPWGSVPELPGGGTFPAAAPTARSDSSSLSNSPCAFLRLQQAQLTSVSGQLKGAWKLPVRQWECTTGKNQLEEVSGKKASELRCPFSPSVFKVHLSQPGCSFQSLTPWHLGT